MVVGELAENFITYYFEQMQTILKELGFEFNGDVPLPDNTPEYVVPCWASFAERYGATVTLEPTTYIKFVNGLSEFGLPQLTLGTFRFCTYPQIGVGFSFVDSLGNTQNQNLLVSSARAQGGTFTSNKTYGGPECYWMSDAPYIVTTTRDNTNFNDYKDYLRYGFDGNRINVYRKEPFNYNDERDFFQDVIVKEPTFNIPSDYVVPELPKDPHDLGAIPSIDIPALPQIPIDFDALEGTTADAGGILQWMLDAYTAVGIAPVLLFSMAVCIIITALRR